MRRLSSIARIAVIETLSRPLSAVLFLVAVLSVHLLPAFQYHRFGAPGRLSVEAGMSALFVFGLCFAVPAAAKAIGREIDDGTASIALSLGISRTLFFCGRIIGVMLVFALFALSVCSATALSSFSCIKAASMVEGETVSRVWGPAFGIGVSGPILAFAFSAALNRFCSARFCLWACVLVAFSQTVAFLFVGVPQQFAALFSQFLVLSLGGMVFVAMAGTFAVRLGDTAVTSCVAVAIASSFLHPFRFLTIDIGRTWLAQYASVNAILTASASALALVTMWVTIGCIMFERREIP